MLLLACAVFIPSGLRAGDVAVFSDMGFSEDGKIYVFGEYGVIDGGFLPWAELFVVDVPRNNFKPGGKLKFSHSQKIKPGQDGSGALYNLLAANSAMVEKYGISFLLQGIPLYISLENNPLDGNPAGIGTEVQKVSFRDFDTDIFYTATLKPFFYGADETLSSSFYIDLTSGANENEVIQTYKAGSPDVKRSGVSSYMIRKVIISADRKSLIFVIEMTRRNAAGEAPDIRYMIEALRLP